MKIIEYNSSYSARLVEFVKLVFAENDIPLDLLDKHSDFLHPTTTYSKFWIAINQEKVVGCIGLKDLSLENKVAELKRLYLLKEYHGLGYGGKMIDIALQFAKDMGYHSIRLDTKEKFANAVALIKKKGFYQIPRYNNSTATLFYEIKL